jgi:hypothetical protein
MGKDGPSDFGNESQLRVQAVVMLPTSILNKSK